MIQPLVWISWEFMSVEDEWKIINKNCALAEFSSGKLASMKHLFLIEISISDSTCRSCCFSGTAALFFKGKIWVTNGGQWVMFMYMHIIIISIFNNVSFTIQSLTSEILSFEIWTVLVSDRFGILEFTDRRKTYKQSENPKTKTDRRTDGQTNCISASKEIG